ncbi:MAG: hypothetical protein WBQ08_14060 [Candidatus Sulfotelmatobacter sp.]
MSLEPLDIDKCQSVLAEPALALDRSRLTQLGEHICDRLTPIGIHILHHLLLALARPAEWEIVESTFRDFLAVRSSVS